MKILFLISKLHYSGAPKMMAWIANQMAARGHRVTLISMYDRDNSQQLSPAVTLRLLGRHKSKSRLARNTVDLAGTLHALRQCVREEQPDVVVSFLDAAAIARGLLRLAEDEALSNRIAQNAIQIAEKFPEGPIADQWEQALLELTDL